MVGYIKYLIGLCYCKIKTFFGIKQVFILAE